MSEKARKHRVLFRVISENRITTECLYGKDIVCKDKNDCLKKLEKTFGTNIEIIDFD